MSTADPAFRRVGTGDAEALCAFYNGLSQTSVRRFRPLGPATDVAACAEIIAANDPTGETKLDVIALSRRRVIGWCFIWRLADPEPVFGLGIADSHQGRGLGSRLAAHVMKRAEDRGLPLVTLTVVTDNAPAQAIYRRLGFRVTGRFVSENDGLDYYRMRWERPSFPFRSSPCR